MTANSIIERIEREIGVPGLASLLAERLSPTDLQSLLLDVYRQRAQRISPATLLAEFERNAFVQVSPMSPVRLLEWERAAFDALPPEFEPLALSPVCPLGTSSAVGEVDQNRVLTTIRNTEVVSDSTNVLALECALRRRTLLRANPKSKARIHLAASHRLLRTQRYNTPGVMQHFSAFALCSAGQDEGNLRFELATLVLHVVQYVRAIRAFAGSPVPIRLAVINYSAAERQSAIDQQLFTPIAESFSGVECIMDEAQPDQRGYYTDFRFHLYASTSVTDWMELVDGGTVNWTQKLLSNAKERCVISGIGSERVLTLVNQPA